MFDCLCDCVEVVCVDFVLVFDGCEVFVGGCEFGLL